MKAGTVTTTRDAQGRVWDGIWDGDDNGQWNWDRDARDGGHGMGNVTGMGTHARCQTRDRDGGWDGDAGRG